MASWTEHDVRFVEQAVTLALESEKRGDLPVGCVITLDDQIVAAAGNRMLSEGYQPLRHAEHEALARVPDALWSRAKEMTCYTTLEPCLMCFGTLLLCGVGRVVFGAIDTRGGAHFVFDAMPPFYADDRSMPAWVGPLLPETCDPLYVRVDARFRALPGGTAEA